MASEPDLAAAMRTKDRVHNGWPAIATLAESQHGTVARFQLIDLGFSNSAINRLLRECRLHRIHRGVYAVGHRKLSRQGWRMAAVLSGGPGAVLSHRAAGSEWQLANLSGRNSVTATTWRRSTEAVRFHSSSLPADEITVLDGIPITSVPRTLLDLATLLDPHRLLNAVNEAEQRELSDPLSLPALLERHHGERGTARLRSVLENAGYGVPREALEELFARFVAVRGLPRPELNAWIRIGPDYFSPDCLWRGERLIVELHSARHHGTTPAITRDASRDRRLMLAGWLVIHVTWAQLHDPREADALERDLRRALLSR